MPLCTFEKLLRQADSARQQVPVAAAGVADASVLEALRQACDRGWVRPLVLGCEGEIRRVAQQAGIDLNGFAILDAADPAAAAVSEVRGGRARVLMKGQIATPDLMRAVLDPANGLRSSRVICQVVLMEIVPEGRMFLMADTGVTIAPDLEKKADILRSAVSVAHALGEPRPRVALLAATEKVVETMPETFHAAELARRAAHGEFPGCLVQGPLSFDLAYAADAADKKRVGGEVAGAADALIFPNLAAANLTVKAIMYTAHCRFGGVLMGTTHPVVFMSRADTTETRLRSLALAVRLVDRGPEPAGLP
jgi:phosphate butyryltransferase